jgi:hypothetical protein
MGEGANLQAIITGNSTGFQQALDGARQHAKKFADEVTHETTSSWTSGVKGFIGGLTGIASFESVKGFIEGIVSRAAQIKDIAEQFDLTTDSVQRWEKATEKAGLSTNLFYRALEALRAKRQEAREDAKKMEPFERLGLASSAKDMSVTDEDLLKRVLASSGSRIDINEVLGRRGANLRAALPNLNGSPLFSSTEIEQIDLLDKAAKNYMAGFKKLGVVAVRSLFELNDSKIDLLKDAFSLQLPGTNWKKRHAADAERQRADEEERQRVAREDALDAAQAQNDAELEAAEKKRLETEAKEREVDERLREARRKAMSPMKRLQDERAEMSDLDRQIGDYESAGDLLSPTDKERLASLKLKRAGLYNEVRANERALMPHVEADSMAKQGLFVGGALMFNPALNVQQEQLSVLRSIDRKMSDPHRTPFHGSM